MMQDMTNMMVGMGCGMGLIGLLILILLSFLELQR
jgi:hypothetical protein